MLKEINATNAIRSQLNDGRTPINKIWQGGVVQGKKLYFKYEFFNENQKVWDLFYEADVVRAMLTRLIKEESLRTYLFACSHVYDSISMATLAEMFEMEKSNVHFIVSKMIINEELMMHETSRTKDFQILGKRMDLDISVPERLLLAAKLITSYTNLLLHMSVLRANSYLNVFIYKDYSLVTNLEQSISTFVTGNVMEVIRKDLIHVLLNNNLD